MAARAEPAAVSDPTQSFTEKTEPFPESEMDARLQSIRMQRESFKADDAAPVHLDELVVPPDKGIRILVRPLRSRSVSPANHDNCEWLALHAEVASPESPSRPQHTVLAVTQTSKDIKFSVRVPGGGSRAGDSSGGEVHGPTLWCEMYYDTDSDHQIFVNKSDLPLTLTRVSQLPPMSPGTEHKVLPFTPKKLPPGTWRIKVDDIDVLDFRIVEKRPALMRIATTSSSGAGSSLNEMVNSSGKRSFVADEDDPAGPDARRIRGSDGSPSSRKQDGVIEFLPSNADKLVFTLPTGSNSKSQELVPFNGQPLLDMQPGDTVQIPGGCELDQYRITKRDLIASTTLSSVFKSTAEHLNIPPNSIITVKVLKTRAAPSYNGLIKPLENERNIIRQAEGWQREFLSHGYLQHDHIPKLYGGDARYLSLYMEHVDAHDLTIRGTWRGTNNDYFVGTKADAMRILRDISGALNYIHSRNLVHNDIKPSNILFSPERGAVLCDFGLSAHTRSPPTAGGTPYYVPPEYIGNKQRGSAGDVWALGVTMLYVLRKLPWPESRMKRRENQRPLFWMIADLHRTAVQARGASQAVIGGRPGVGSQVPHSAVVQMQTWLNEVKEARDKLDHLDRLQCLVGKMLAPNPAQRISARRIMTELFAEQAPQPKQLPTPA